MKEKKAKIAISLDQDVLKKAKEKAKKEGRTLSNYINQTLKSIK